MGQILDGIKNPWAAAGNPGWIGSLDPQRTDLFTIDFSEAITSINLILLAAVNGPQGNIARSLLGAMPTRSNAAYFPSGVDIPERSVAYTTTRRHEIAYNLPSWDGAQPPLNVTWTMDSGNSVFKVARPLVLLRAWTAIVRAGRDGQDPNELYLDLLTASGGRGYVPDYKHDFVVYLWRGKSDAATPAAFTSAATPENAGVELAGRWLVRNAWLTGFQQPSLSHAGGSAVGTIRSTFACDAVVEI